MTYVDILKLLIKQSKDALGIGQIIRVTLADVFMSIIKCDHILDAYSKSGKL